MYFTGLRAGRTGAPANEAWHENPPAGRIDDAEKPQCPDAIADAMRSSGTYAFR
jgi:hypothetical protein